MKDFIEYAIVGVRFFTHKYTIGELLSEGIINIILVAFPIIVLILMFIKYIRNKDARILISVFLILFLAGSVVAYPLSDYSHLILAVTPLVPCLFYSIKISPVKSVQEIFCIFFAIMIASYSVYRFIPSSDNYKNCELKHFSGIPIEISFEEHIRIIDDFILENEKKGEKVIVVERIAAMYSVPLDRYTKNYDMLLVGNLGNNTVYDLIQQENATMYLLPKRNIELERQSHFELIEYIRENYTYSGDVLNYEVYRK